MALINDYTLLIVLVVTIVKVNPHGDYSSHMPRSISGQTPCACTLVTLQCCQHVVKYLMEGYGTKQYRLKNALTPSAMEMPCLKYYTCKDGKCIFHNLNAAKGERSKRDDGTTDPVRGRRSVVDTCCGVISSVVEVTEVVNIEDTDDVWFVFRDDNNRGPAFISRTCNNPNSSCGDKDGECRAVLDTHGVLVYRFSISLNKLEYRYVPVTFNVGCECRSTP